MELTRRKQKQSRKNSKITEYILDRYLAPIFSNLSDHDLQTLIKSTFELADHFKQFDVSTSSRHYLRTRHDGDAGRGIHEEPCTCPASPLTKKNNQLNNGLFMAIEDLDLHQQEPFRRRPVKSVVHIAREVLHEASLMTNSERDLTPFCGKAGTNILCTVSAFKIALGTSRPAVR